MVEGRWYFHVTSQVYLGYYEEVQNLSCKPTPTPLEVGLKLYGHDDSNSVDVTLYRQLVESLIYLTTT
jgi:hypothetical protein